MIMIVGSVVFYPSGYITYFRRTIGWPIPRLDDFTNNYRPSDFVFVA